MSKFRWNIDGSLMNQCKKMRPFEKALSDNFDDNNWCLRVCPNGVDLDHEGCVAIIVQCCSMLFKFKKIEFKFNFLVNGDDSDDLVNGEDVEKTGTLKFE